MRILIVTAGLPYPPHQGGALRAYGILHGLHQAGHHITLLSFQQNTLGDTPLADLCQQIVTVPTPSRTRWQRLQDLLLTPNADIQNRLKSDAMQARLQNLLQTGNYDLVQFEGIEVGRYLFDAQQAAPNVATLYDAFNAEAALQQVIAQTDRHDLQRLPNAAYSYLQVGRIKRFEQELCQAATGVIAVSEEDAAILAAYRDDRHISVVPSGIFTDDYIQTDPLLTLKPNALVFTGKMDYRPNVDAMMWFAERVLPTITDEIDAHLYIVGQKPHNRLNALRMNPHISITGWVPAVHPYLQAADVYVAPLRMGSGTRLKMLEAMAAGCPLVATTAAAAGLKSAAKTHMHITDDTAEMAAVVMDLLQQPENRVKLGQQAHTYIREHYDWSVLIPRLLNVYRELGLE